MERVRLRLQYFKNALIALLHRAREALQFAFSVSEGFHQLLTLTAAYRTALPVVELTQHVRPSRLALLLTDLLQEFLRRFAHRPPVILRNRRRDVLQVHLGRYGAMRPERDLTRQGAAELAQRVTPRLAVDVRDRWQARPPG